MEGIGGPSVPQPLVPPAKPGAAGPVVEAPGPVVEGTKSQPAATPQDTAAVAQRAQHETGTDFDLDAVELEKLAANPKTPGEELAKLAKSDDVKVRQQVAGNPSTPSAVLEKLAADQNPDVRATAAWNQKTPSQVLEKLARDQDPDVRAAAAGNYKTPSYMLTELARELDPGARAAVAGNPSTPRDVLQELANDPEPDVRGEAKSRQAYLQQLDDAINELKQLQQKLASVPSLGLVDDYRTHDSKLMEKKMPLLEKAKTAGDPAELRSLAQGIRQAGRDRPAEAFRENPQFTEVINRYEALVEELAHIIAQRAIPREE